MLTQEQQKAIAKLLKLDEAKFVDALKSDKEVEVEIPELQVFTKTELDSRDTNQKKLGYNEGKEAGLEIFIKDQKTKHSLEFEGKDPDKFVQAFQTKILADAKIEPSQKLQEKDTIIQKLQSNITEFETKNKELEQRLKSTSLKSKLTVSIPTDLPVDANEVLASMQIRGYSFEEDDKGKIVPKKDGEILRDPKTQDPLPHDTVITGYIEERKWKPEADPGKTGRGGASDRRTASSTPGTLSAAKKAWEDEGKSANSSEFQAYVEGLVKDNKDFNLDE